LLIHLCVLFNHLVAPKASIFLIISLDDRRAYRNLFFLLQQSNSLSLPAANWCFGLRNLSFYWL
jgi:hypothetical protein